MIKVFLKLQQKVGASGEKVSLCIFLGKNDKFIYYYGKRIHKIR